MSDALKPDDTYRRFFIEFSFNGFVFSSDETMSKEQAEDTSERMKLVFNPRDLRIAEV